MSVPHLTRNEGREFLSNGLEPLNLVREGDFSDLFGVRIVGKGDVFGNIVSEPEADDNPIDGLTQHPSFFRFPPLPPHHDRARLAEVEVTDAEILARESESRRPVLVRRRLGRGEAYLLCTWAYPGNSWLVPFVNPLIRSLAVKSAGLISLTDGMGDVYYSVRVEGDVHRIHLLNTDWTEAENKKPCRLRLGDCWIDLEVGEGTVTEIIWIDSLVLIVDDPRLYVARIEHTGGEYRAEVHGCGSVEIQIFMIGEVKLTTLAFRDHAVRHQLDGEHGWYRAKLDFSGSSVGEMSIESNARMD